MKRKNIRARFFKLITITYRKIHNQNGDEKSIKTKNEWNGNALRTRECCTACRAFGNVFIKNISWHKHITLFRRDKRFSVV